MEETGDVNIAHLAAYREPAINKALLFPSFKPIITLRRRIGPRTPDGTNCCRPSMEKALVGAASTPMTVVTPADILAIDESEIKDRSGCVIIIVAISSLNIPSPRYQCRSSLPMIEQRWISGLVELKRRSTQGEQTYDTTTVAQTPTA